MKNTHTLGKPSIDCLKEWFKKGTYIEINEVYLGQEILHKGRIKSLQTFGNCTDEAFIFFKNEVSGLFLRNITSYFATPQKGFIFLNDPESIIDKFQLKSGNKTFTVSKSLLIEKSHFFEALLKPGFAEEKPDKIDLSKLLSEEQLEALLFMLNSNDLKFISNSKQALYLLGATDKTSAPEHLNAIKDKIFELITIDNYNLFLKNIDSFDKTEQLFLENISEEIISYCKRNNTKINSTVLEHINCPRIEKSLTIMHEKYPFGHSIEEKQIQLYGKDISKVLTLLELYGIEIENLYIKNISFCELKPVFSYLKNNKYIKSISTEWTNIATCQPTVYLSDITELLEFMNSAEQLTEISIGTTGREKEGDAFRSEVQRINSSSVTFAKEAYIAFNKAQKKLLTDKKLSPVTKPGLLQDIFPRTESKIATEQTRSDRCNIM